MWVYKFHWVVDLLLVKLPFPLTLGFKQMLQRGIDTPDMDVRWVSSLSWYILNWFGLNGLFRLLLGNDNGITLVLLPILDLIDISTYLFVFSRSRKSSTT